MFVNREEAAQLTGNGTQDIRHLALAVWQLGAQLVVVTDGQNGAYAFDGKSLSFCPIFPSKRVEATGAGDAFSSGYLAARFYNHNISAALSWGIADSCADDSGAQGK